MGGGPSRSPNTSTNKSRWPSQRSNTSSRSSSSSYNDTYTRPRSNAVDGSNNTMAFGDWNLEFRSNPINHRINVSSLSYPTAPRSTPTLSTIRQNEAVVGVGRGRSRAGRSNTSNTSRTNSVVSERSQTLSGRFTDASLSQPNRDGKKEFKIPTAEVLMPTGIRFTITLPSKPKCFCKTFNETRLIKIWPNSKLCPGEHQMLCDEMNNTIKPHLSGSFTRYRIISIQKVKNCCLWTKYKNRLWDITKEVGEHNLNERMLFHGSAAADDIVKCGFDERHSDAGGMFGAGVYFAEHSSKSNQYSFGRVGNGCPDHGQSDCKNCERKMILCRVVLGNILIREGADKMSHPPPGYHSVKGTPTLFGLKYPEYVIYRGEQAYPEYLITYKII